MIRWFVSIFILSFSSSIWAQYPAVSGIVSDAKGNELIGATLYSSVDTVISDVEGKFNLEYDPAQPILTVSYIGFQTKEIQIDSEFFTIVLKVSNNLLETAVVTASMNERNISESTVSIEVLKPELLNNTNAVTLSEGLKLIPGLEIIDGQPNIRGGSGYSYGAGSRVLLLIDNIPALQPDAGLPNWNDVAIENIAQVEVVKGAASALYGSSALNGIINVRYAQPGSEPETQFSTQYTLFGNPSDPRMKWWDSSPQSYSTSLIHRQKFNKIDLVAGAQYLNLNSFRASTSQQRGRIIFNTRYRLSGNTTIGANVTGNISRNESFIFWANAVRGAYLPFPGTEVGSVNNRWIVDPFITHFDQYGNKHRLQGRFYHTDNGVANGLDNFSRLLFGEYQFQKEFKWGLNITTGVAGNYTFVNAGLYGGAQYLSYNAGIYLQADQKVNDKLSLSAGGRFEYNSLENDAFTIVDGSYTEAVEAGVIQESKPVFRFGANYRIGNFTHLRASLGQGYRFPTIAEKFTTVGLANFRIFTNPQLGSETGWSSEIGIKQGLKVKEWYGFIDLAAFWSEYNSMMEFLLTAKNGVFGFQSRNIGDTRIRGIDASLGASSSGIVPVSLIMGYTYIDPRYKDFNEVVAASSSVDFNVLKYRSLHSFKWDLNASFKGFFLGGNMRYLSHMLAIDEEFNLFIPGLRNYRAVNNKGFNVFNMRTGYEYKRYKLTFLINNIFNTTYSERPAMLEAPRNYALRLDIKI